MLWHNTQNNYITEVDTRKHKLFLDEVLVHILYNQPRIITNGFWNGKTISKYNITVIKGTNMV